MDFVAIAQSKRKINFPLKMRRLLLVNNFSDTVGKLCLLFSFLIFFPLKFFFFCFPVCSFSFFVIGIITLLFFVVGFPIGKCCFLTGIILLMLKFGTFLSCTHFPNTWSTLIELFMNLSQWLWIIYWSHSITTDSKLSITVEIIAYQRMKKEITCRRPRPKLVLFWFFCTCNTFNFLN